MAGYESRGSILLVLPLLATATGCGPDDDSGPFIEITEPTTIEAYSTTLAVVTIGGNVANATRIDWTNIATGESGTATGPLYTLSAGLGTWFDDAIGLAMGENVITFTTDAGASDTLTITRIIIFSSDSKTQGYHSDH